MAALPLTPIQGADVLNYYLELLNPILLDLKETTGNEQESEPTTGQPERTTAELTALGVTAVAIEEQRNDIHTITNTMEKLDLTTTELVGSSAMLSQQYNGTFQSMVKDINGMLLALHNSPSPSAQTTAIEAIDSRTSTGITKMHDIANRMTGLADIFPNDSLPDFSSTIESFNSESSEEETPDSESEETSEESVESEGEEVSPYYIMRRLMDADLEPPMSLETAAAFAGNIQWESGSHTSDAIGDLELEPGWPENKKELRADETVGARGLCQWRDPRLGNLHDYAENNYKKPKSWKDKDVQIDFIIHELKGDESYAYERISAAGAVDPGKEAEVKAKTKAVDEFYERSTQLASHVTGRVDHAKAFYSVAKGLPSFT